MDRQSLARVLAALAGDLRNNGAPLEGETFRGLPFCEVEGKAGRAHLSMMSAADTLEYWAEELREEQS